MPWINPEGLAALLSLTVLEITLGVDNFLHIRRSLDSLPVDSRLRAHKAISFLTLCGRIFLVVWLVSLLRLPNVHTLYGQTVNLHELGLFMGACILMIKVASDILRIAIVPNTVISSQRQHASFGTLVTQIVLLDLFLSIDSAVTAVAMAEQVWVMISALVAAEFIMYRWANAIDSYIKKNGHISTLLNAFTLMLGMVLFLRANGGAVPMALLYCILLFIIVTQLTRELPELLKKRASSSSILGAHGALAKKPYASKMKALACEVPMNSSALVDRIGSIEHFENSFKFEQPRWLAQESDTIYDAGIECISVAAGEINYQFYSFEPRQEQF